VNPYVQGVLTLLGVFAASYLTYLASRQNKRADAAQTMIDQHQEDIVSLRARVAALERADRIKSDYIGVLRRHIADGHPPPPPPWPAELLA